MRGFKKVLAVSLLLGSSVYGLDHTYELTPYVGKNFTDSKLNMSDPTVVGVNFDTYFSENFGIRVGYERLMGLEKETSLRTNAVTSSSSNSNNSCDFDMEDDIDINRFSLNAMVRYAIPGTSLTPYLFAGLGNEFCADGDCSSVWTKNFGLGLGYDINCDWKLSPEVKIVNRDRDCGDESENLTDVVASLGVSYKFGKPNVVDRVVVQQVPVDRIVMQRVEVPVETCRIPTNFKDRCDNSYYIQVAGFYLCPTCPPRIKDKALLRKLKGSGYNYSVHTTTTKTGDRVGKVLIGPYRCKKNAFAEICKIKKYFRCDAFVYSKRR
jgi:opacity protein-like surface antigen